MALIENWLPPSQANWEAVVFWWQFFPVVRIRCVIGRDHS